MLKKIINFIFCCLIFDSSFSTNLSVGGKNVINIAVASNFSQTIHKLAKRFEMQNKAKVVVSTGSTGKLFAQIIYGAPFDIMLAADDVRPRLLIKKGLAVESSLIVYAIGKLALLAPGMNVNHFRGSALKNKKKLKLAIANPQLAPYGSAAMQVLEYLHFNIKDNTIIMGENINQTVNFVVSGNTNGGLVALSLCKQLHENIDNNDIWEIPSHMYSPIIQQAVLLQRGVNNQVALRFMRYLQSAEAKGIIKNSGYGIS